MALKTEYKISWRCNYCGYENYTAPRNSYICCKVCGEHIDENINVIEFCFTYNSVEFALVKLPSGLLMGKHPITQAQWYSIIGDNPSRFTGDSSRPVEYVSWNDCQEFIKKLNAHLDVKSAGITFRLPTEEEWEYACRAESTGKYGLLADGREGTLDEMGWYEDNSGGETHSVGQKNPNAWGLYDMHGNVWEWTASWVGDYRIYRGGSWWNCAENCEADYRGQNFPISRANNLGFRVVAESNKKKTRDQLKDRLDKQNERQLKTNLFKILAPIIENITKKTDDFDEILSNVLIASNEKLNVWSKRLEGIVKNPFNYLADLLSSTVESICLTLGISFQPGDRERILNNFIKSTEEETNGEQPTNGGID